MSDTFTFSVTAAEKPYTRRGILSVINSLYDPLGLVAPVTIRGKMILRKVVTDSSDWDCSTGTEPFRMGVVEN